MIFATQSICKLLQLSYISTVLIVVVISNFEAPTKAKSREPAYSQALVQQKIDWQRALSRELIGQTYYN